MCLQNDLVHGWGLDFALRRCVDVSHLSIYLSISVGVCVCMHVDNESPSPPYNGKMKKEGNK